MAPGVSMTELDSVPTVPEPAGIPGPAREAPLSAPPALPPRQLDIPLTEPSVLSAEPILSAKDAAAPSLAERPRHLHTIRWETLRTEAMDSVVAPALAISTIWARTTSRWEAVRWRTKASNRSCSWRLMATCCGGRPRPMT